MQMRQGSAKYGITFSVIDEPSSNVTRSWSDYDEDSTPVPPRIWRMHYQGIVCDWGSLGRLVLSLGGLGCCNRDRRFKELIREGWISDTGISAELRSPVSYHLHVSGSAEDGKVNRADIAQMMVGWYKLIDTCVSQIPTNSNLKRVVLSRLMLSCLVSKTDKQRQKKALFLPAKTATPEKMTSETNRQWSKLPLSSSSSRQRISLSALTTAHLRYLCCSYVSLHLHLHFWG